MKFLGLFFLLAGGVLFADAACAQGPEKEKAAVKAAREWLSLMESGAYEQTWKAASRFFKSSVNREKWIHSLKGITHHLGGVVSRELKSATYKTALPGVPDGEYVVIRFKTAFENKKSAIETVTPMYEKQENAWKVAGYYIK